MSLNFFTLASSLLVGLTAGAGAAHSLRSGSNAWIATLRALAIGVTGTVIAMIGTVVIAGFDFFALVHLIYLLSVVAIPVAAAVTLFGATPVPKPLAVALCALLFLAPLGMYTTRVEPVWLRVDHVTLAAPNAKNTFRIGVLADLQTTSIGGYENNAIDELIAHQPDIVLIPGDFWHMSPTEFDERWPEFADAMKRLDEGVPHVIAVNGNTDTVAGLVRITGDTGVRVLDNRIAEITIGETSLQIAGITLFGDDEFGAARTIRQLTGQVGADMRILLGHQPDEIFRVRETPVDLVVAGHTHGGQVSIPFFGPPLTLSDVPRTVGAGGLHELFGSPIYVSTGVGRERHHAPQIRLGARPSIGIIDVVPT